MIIHYIQLTIILKNSKLFYMKNFELLQVWFFENHIVLRPEK